MEQQEKEAVKQISVKEFRMWLEGVIEMQDEGWVPDARQWTRILGKIYEIAETKPSSGYQLPQTFNDPIPQPLPQQPVNYQLAPSGLSRIPVGPANLNGPFAADNGNVPVRTPNIDSSTGYDTPFA